LFKERLNPCRDLLALLGELHPNVELIGSLDVLELRVAEAVLGEQRSRLINGDSLVEIERHRRAPGELYPHLGMPHPDLHEREDPQEHEHGRKPQTNEALPHEVNMDLLGDYGEEAHGWLRYRCRDTFGVLHSESLPRC
jgi:hypothetical protein